MDSFEGLCEILAEEYELAAESLTPETPLSELAIDSLGVIELIFAIEEKFAVSAHDADPRSLRQFLTLADVTAYIEELRAQPRASEGPQTATARIHGELAGYGLNTDIEHITRPSVAGQAETMRLALASAALDPCAIGYINAHGTATAANDVVETAAIRAVFGDHANHLPVSSTKSMHAHLLGAAGAIELVATLLALESGTVPPTLNLSQPDPQCDLDYVPNTARSGLHLFAAMSNSFAFGGTNATLVVRAANA